MNADVSKAMTVTARCATLLLCLALSVGPAAGAKEGEADNTTERADKRPTPETEEITSAQRRTPELAYDKSGPFTVRTIEHLGLRDAKRKGRRVPIKVHYPEGKGPFPLVIISHGGAGNWDANVTQAQHLASHGYVVLCLTHVSSDNRRIRFYMSRAGGRMRFWDALHRITTDPKAVLERPKDVSFAIDMAIQWNQSARKLKGKIRTDRIAVMGHSYGAYTTLVVCGARPILDYLDPPVAPGKGLGPDLSDPRISVGLAMSPQGPGGTFFGRDSYKTINRPLMCLSGSRDLQKGAAGEIVSAESRMDAFESMPPGGKVMLWLANADHLAFSYNPNARIQLRSTARPDAQRISKAVMVLFCDIHLKDKKEAKGHLNEKYINTLCGDVVTKVDWFEK